MPRTKHSQRCQAAKKRMADRRTEGLPPLKKPAEISEHCVHHNVHKITDLDNFLKKPDLDNFCKEPTIDNFRKEFTIDNFCKEPTIDNFCKEPTIDNLPENDLEKPLKSLKNKKAFSETLPQSSSMPQSSSLSLSTTNDTKMTVNDVSALSPQTSYISGSFHQGDYRFGRNRGSQCGANCLTAIMMCKMKSVLQWTRSDLNAVLIHGNDLYSAMRDAGKINDPESGFIAVHELPDTHTLKDCRFSINYGETLTGLFGVNKYDGELQGYAMSFDEAVNRAFQRFDTVLVNIKLTICAAVREGSWYAVIDPHSRRGDGRCVADGKSVVVYHRNLHSLIVHFRKLAVSINARYQEFEVTGVNAVMTGKKRPFWQVVENAGQAENESESEKSDVEVDVGCSQFLNDFMDKTSVKETCAQQRTKTPYPTNENAGDVTFLSQTASVSLRFSPLTFEQQKGVCLKLNIANIVKQQNNPPETVEVVEPCETNKIVSDENSFFRALAFAVSGTEREHRKVRRAVVTHILQNEDKYVQYLKQGHSSVPDYIAKTRMKFVGNRATEMEIQAASDLIGIDIFTYSQDKWFRFSSSNASFNAHGCQDSGIYLKHVNSCHYEVVVCGKSKDGDCVLFCKSPSQHSLCDLASNVSLKSREDSSEKLDCSNSTEFKEEKQMKAKKRLHEDETYISIMKSINKKYKKNEQHKGKVKKSVNKYNSNDLHYKAVSEMEADVGCSKSLTYVTNTDKISGNETCVEQKTEMPSLYPTKENSGDVEFVSETVNVSLKFSPLTLQQQKSVCLKLNIVNIIKEDNNPNEIIEMAEPCETKSILGDGNCFFRAVAFAVSGSEEEHRKVRRAVITHILQNEDKYVQNLRQGYSSVPEYIATSRMKYVGTWATEMEIQAASDLIGVDIFTYSREKWLKYKSSNISRQSCQQHGIYLKHVNSCHYEVVVCVKTNNNTCACFCKASSQGSAYNIHLKASSKLRKLYKERLRYSCDHDFKEKKKMETKERYEENKIYKEKKIKCSTKKYKVNKWHQEKVRKYSTDKYRMNDLHCEAVKQYSIQKYHTDIAHKDTVKQLSIQKYNENTAHRESVKRMSIQKYNEDTEHRESVKKMSIQKYNEDTEHRESVKKMSILKYNSNKTHKEMVINYNVQKYKTDFTFVNNIKMRNAERQYKSQLKMKEIDYVIEQFKQKISTGPEYVCSVCHRCCFKMQVKKCNQNKYLQKSIHAGCMAEKCITLKYLHECNKDCRENCVYNNSPAASLWICHTCDTKICEGKMPAESVANNLSLDPIPTELSSLNSLEQHLIGMNIPFMKMLALPRGGQNGICGPVVCIPSNVSEVVNVLPRSENDFMIPIKLKRKLTYKGHYEYKFVNSDKIKTALTYLKENNKWYTDVEFNKTWINPLSKIEEEMTDKTENNDMDLDNCEDMRINEEQNIDNDDNELSDETLHDRQQHGLFMDSCLQPVDIAQEVLDQHFDGIMSLAPAEGNNPVRMLMDETNEAKCFPVLFPKGKGTFHDSRSEKLTLSRYLNNRILNADGRFAQNLDYIFYGQYLSELNQIMSNVSIALRKGYDSSNKRKITSEMLTNKDSLQMILNYDEGYKFLRPVRGSPVFWQAVQKDLFAMVRQLGIPTWFCSFSSADLRWPELLQCIVKQEGCQTPIDELDWSDRCGMLKRNPVTAARMFDHRFHCFLKDVIMSPAQPIGKIIDYFYRIEFQQRGSPHTHCLFWVENAPQVDREDDDEVVAFVDHYVTCEMPPEDETEMHEIVSTVQQHSKRHAKTCRKKGTTCRFNFPRPPSQNTFISRSRQTDKNEKTTDDGQCESKDKRVNNSKEISKELAESIMKKVRECLLNNVASIGINQEIFECAYNKMTKKTNVVLKRKPSDVWVNQYNKDLLRCWNANMDIQFVVDAYSCIVYIISYISKAEREMGLLLANAQKEAHKDGNMDAKQALRKLGSVFLHNREVSAQESVYRLTNMRLKEGSRKVVFIPTGINTVKMSLPLNIINKKAEKEETDNDEIWMKSITDRYRARPKTQEFTGMCLASFASEYRVLSKSEKSCTDRVKLENDMGFVRKRTRTDFAVVRYARFSPTKNPENYYQSILELFLPHFLQSQLKPPNFTSYQEFYETGFVTLYNDELESVKIIVDTNRSKFEKEADSIQKAQDDLEQHGPMEDAWAQICPEAELERLECLDTRKEQPIETEEGDDVIPDLLPNVHGFTLEKNPCAMTKKDAMCLLRSLNDKQSQIFYKVRQWCLAKVQGENPDPFHVFISGPGGVGKSVLIKAMYYETSRILSKLSENPDETHVLLTAPTGVSAFNISAKTIHSTFSIGMNATLPYQPLGDEKINSLRAKFGKLQILIIDEISMVDHKLLAYIHGRLRQIKQTGDYSAFGKVSVIAVGDFYQLSPIKGKPLYTEPVNSVNLWETHFSFIELTEIMRQKDKEFAELLSRLRLRKKDEPMREADVAMLKKCETGDGDDSTDIHIYATNSEVDVHNIHMLHKLCSDTVTVKAQDFERNAKTGRMEEKDGYHFRVHNSCLEKSLELAIGARIMLIKNINVSDGLVNGVFGTIKELRYDDNETFPSKIYIEFDKEQIGKQARTKNPCLKPGLEKATPIEPEEEKVTNDGGVRRQYPIRLAWACTVHKVQGLTVDKAVVSMKKIFAAGQAYVALSRVTSLDGLIIEDFKENVIFAKDNIEQALQNMPPFILPCETTETFTYKMMLHNVEGLIPHILDIRQDNRYFEADMICVTETWLKSNNVENEVSLDGYYFHGKTRSAAYDTSEDVFAKLKEENHGGVGIYHKEKVKVALMDLQCMNIECMMCRIEHLNTTVAVVYRPPSYNIALFQEKLTTLVNEMNCLPGGKIILGDFNENLFNYSSIHHLMQHFGFTQIVEKPTTENNTLIDHVYVKDIDLDKIKIDIMPTYFSYHDCVVLKWLA
uniref:ATP-dependent DNA helicase n=1 Tax=Cyprinus carpio carpio TaxID=630221 RepID=A0A9J7WX60_CYPCA